IAVPRIPTAVPAIVVLTARHDVIVVISGPVRRGIVARRTGLRGVGIGLMRRCQVVDNLRLIARFFDLRGDHVGFLQATGLRIKLPGIVGRRAIVDTVAERIRSGPSLTVLAPGARGLGRYAAGADEHSEQDASRADLAFAHALHCELIPLGPEEPEPR